MKNNIKFQYSKWIDESTVLTEEMFKKIKSKPIIGIDFAEGQDKSVSVCMKELNGIYYVNETKNQTKNQTT